MRCYLDVKFNRGIDPKDIIYSGTIYVTAKGKQYGMDFLDSYCSIDEKDKSILHWEFRNPDLGAFPEIAELSQHLSEIISIDECFVSSDSADLYVTGITGFVIEEGYSKIPEIHYSDYISAEVFKGKEDDDFLVQYSFKDKALIQFNKDNIVDTMFYEADKLYRNTPCGQIRDADTILTDILEENFEQTGIFLELEKILDSSYTCNGREMFHKMFEAFTGVSIIDYLKKVIDETTRGD